MPLPPLKFAPIFRPMPWGGTRLRERLGHPSDPTPTGEAWILSDVDGNLSAVAEGPYAGRTLRELAAEYPAALFGYAAPEDGRFPILLKILDARQELSVQVHPDDARAVAHKGHGHRGKTEAWVVLESDPVTSRIYAGFRPGVTAGDFRAALDAGGAPGTLHHFAPEAGDCVFLPAGTVHAIGADILLFEVQQTSDITYRLYDWDRKDAAGRGRELHLDLGLACSDFECGPCHPVTPRKRECGEALVECDHFRLTRHDSPAEVGRHGHAAAVVCVRGAGTVAGIPIHWGEVVLLPACVGRAAVTGEVTLLSCEF